MGYRKRRFVLLLSGKKGFMGKVRQAIESSPDTHIKFASSPGFLSGRALFDTPDVVLLDVTRDTPALRGAIRDFTTQFPDVPILAMADTPDHGFAVELVKLGVSAYFIVPDEERKIAEQVTLLLNEWRARASKEEFVEQQNAVYDFRHILGSSPLLRTTLERARKIISNNTRTVLITGETGTGKELFARAIHYNSRNRNSPFVDIACSALPESLLESELFGHEKGAFTDARERKIGLFELAGDGSIFLDEIGDISLATQSKLLKVIEDRSMRRLGGIRDVPVRARIIAATSADLEAKMKAREFRRDLYHRLKILPLDLPPLRERREDIPLLAESFLRAFNTGYGKQIRGITPQAVHLLVTHEWEGNVRELKHCIERAVLLEEGDWIDEHDLEFGAAQKSAAKRNVVIDAPASFLPKEADTMMLLIPLDRGSLAEVQRMYVRRMLEHVHGNKAKAARLLRISRPRLDRILKDGGEASDG